MVDISPQGVVAVGGNYRYSNFISPKVLAEKILRQEATSCSLTIPEHKYTRGNGGKLSSTYAPVTIPFYMSQDFGFSLGNDFKELVAIGDNQFIDVLNSVSAFTGGSQVSPQSEAMSSKVWKGSTFGGFTIECLFVCTNRRNNPIELIRRICTCCLPRKIMDGEFGLRDTFTNAFSAGVDTMALGVNTITGNRFKDTVDRLSGTSKALVKDLGMVAPLDYGIELSGEGEAAQWGQPKRGTTVTLQIGNWFRATQLVVKSISSVSFSKEIIAPGNGNLLEKVSGGDKYGFPLYGKCSISLEPSSLMHVDKFDGYFMDPSHGVGATVRSLSQDYDLP